MPEGVSMNFTRSASVSVPSENLAFSIGGTVLPVPLLSFEETNVMATNTTLTVDLSNPENPSWTIEGFPIGLEGRL